MADTTQQPPASTQQAQAPEHASTEHPTTEQHKHHEHIELTPTRKKFIRSIALTLGLSVILVGMLLLFIMPSLKSGPHHLEVGIVGSEQTITDIDKALKAQDTEAFDLREYPSAESLNTAIETREITGGFDLSQPDTLRIAVASAGSTAVSGTLTQTGQAIGKQMSLEPKVDDIVALPEADPTGTGIGGLAECFGNKGFTVAAMTMMFVGNPFAGIATSAVWLPTAVAALGQLLPPGATGTLVRAVAYFDGHGGTHGFWTLIGWIAFGLILWGLAPLLSLRSEKRTAKSAGAAD
ncbi:ABC-2 family transporter protein [Corynebacterium urogenitale]|uniref:ABC-2 family transporter protein n=1 Tax=Corynebacterium urogenitale TaxID=2487892 RepID=A0A5J6Z6M4_9CORY|nr:hypothetical protein [Corynebacterium urogenitale]QFQ01872.1 ABC-2 family transporter protein [Corynebacterium urogenitale]